MVSVHLSSFAMPIVLQIILTFYHVAGPCHRFTKLIVCPTHLRNSMADSLIKLENTRKVPVKCLLILSL